MTAGRQRKSISEEIQADKEALRRRVREKLKAMPETQRSGAGMRARALLARQKTWQRARSVLFFAPLPDELDVWPLAAEALAAGKQIALLRFATASRSYIACRVENLATDLEAGPFGVRQPVERCVIVPLLRLDFILVPGVAFDLHGARLGRGKGYYDQLLAAVRGTTCGVAFDEQIVREVPVQPHDVRLNCILTPTRWFDLGPARGLE
jgi:5-formyltetrahydrofolate cyclo-ligase